jgi:hypothetical protein
MWIIYILIVISILVGYELIRNPSLELIKLGKTKTITWLKELLSKWES